MFLYEDNLSLSLILFYWSEVGSPGNLMVILTTDATLRERFGAIYGLHSTKKQEYNETPNLKMFLYLFTLT